MVSKSQHWYVLYTKPRSEIKVLKQLSDMGISVYTPTRIEIRQWSDRKKKVVTPLLPSMVLVRLPEDQLDLVFSVPGVVRYLFEQGKRGTVTEQEVSAMKCYLDHAYQTKQEVVKKGSELRVPVLKQEATVLAVEGRKCLARLKKTGAMVSFQLS